MKDGNLVITYTKENRGFLQPALYPYSNGATDHSADHVMVQSAAWQLAAGGKRSIAHDILSPEQFI
jgi:hypothetical protein